MLKRPMVRWLALAAVLAVILPVSAFLLATRAPAITSKLEDKRVMDLLIGKLRTEGIMPDKLDVSIDTAGMQTVALELSARNAQHAGPFIDQIVLGLRRVIPQLNAEQDAHIVVYTVRVVDAAQKLLYNYENDLQLSSENWWQAEDVHPSWYPAGPPATQLPAEAGLPTPDRTPTAVSYPPTASTAAFLPLVSSP